jgi:type IV pilus assembly protein PilX
MKKQNGLVLVLSLLVLVSVTILGVSAVSSGLLQSKMATSMDWHLMLPKRRLQV